MAIQKIITSLYSWFPAPHNTELNSEVSWIYDPVITSSGTEQKAWWQDQIKDLYWAGVNGAFIGNAFPATVEDQENNENRFVKLSRAIQTLGIPFSVGVIIEKGTQSLLAQYDNIVVPFYDSVRPSRWLKHIDGAGGKPMIYIWQAKTTSVAQFNLDVATLKQRFFDDFGLVPFLCFEPNSSYQFITDYSLVDCLIQWNSPIGGYVQQDWGGFKVASVGVGNNEQLIRPWRCYGDSASNPGYNPLDPVLTHKPRGDLSDPAKFLRTEFAKITPPVNIIFFQDAGELNEGSGIIRAKNYPTPENPIFSECAHYVYNDPMLGTLAHVRAYYKGLDRGWYLPANYYLNVLQELIRGKFPDNVLPANVQVVPLLRNSQFLAQEVPTQVPRSSKFRVKISFRNIGLQPWRRDLSYKMATRNSDLNVTWGDDKRQLVDSETIQPNGIKTFIFNCDSPPAPGTYNFQWCMYKETIGFFGVNSPNVVIQVT